MTTTDKINKILCESYNNYNGTKIAPLKELHQIIRDRMSEDEFLKYLEDTDKINPKPVFKPITY